MTIKIKVEVGGVKPQMIARKSNWSYKLTNNGLFGAGAVASQQFYQMTPTQSSANQMPSNFDPSPHNHIPPIYPNATMGFFDKLKDSGLAGGGKPPYCGSPQQQQQYPLQHHQQQQAGGGYGGGYPQHQQPYGAGGPGGPPGGDDNRPLPTGWVKQWDDN